MSEKKRMNPDVEAHFPVSLPPVLETTSVVPQEEPNWYMENGYRLSQEEESLWMYHPEVVLFNPKIPQNTGSIARLCAAFFSRLHLIEPLGFQLSEKAIRRAGLDYWKWVRLYIHENMEQFLAMRPDRRVVFVETGGEKNPYTFDFHPGDLLVFGAETYGVPSLVMKSTSLSHNTEVITIPMYQKGVRSINLANSVSMVLALAKASLERRKC